MENRVLIAGSGGQGILFLGKLLAYAAMFEGKEVTWFPSYGAEMRGGTANCTVIVSDEMIGSPVVGNPDILIAMNDASITLFSERVASRGLLIHDSLIKIRVPRSDIRIVSVPAIELSGSLNNTKLANMVILGALIAASPLVSIESVFKAVEETTPAHRRDSIGVNKEIILKGYKLLEDKKGEDI